MTKTKGKTILIAGIDTVRQKNRHQLERMAAHGHNFVILTVDADSNSSNTVKGLGNVRLVTAKHGFKGSLYLLSLLKLLLTNRFDIAEVYPYSLTILLATALLKLFRIPIALIARGEEYYYLQGKMPRAMKAAFKGTYQLADHVIYKELYADDFFDSVGMNSRFFLPNAVDVPPAPKTHTPDKCVFLFINSLKPFRHPETPLQAFLELCEQRSLDTTSGVEMRIIGFQGDTAPPDIVLKENEIRNILSQKPEEAPVSLLPWTNDSRAEIRQADVFLLPADVVYLNYSLLEAMADGLVPMIQDAPDSARIIEHGHEGYVLPNTVTAWKKAMEDILNNFESRTAMATAARDKIITNFSLQSYEQRYAEIYRQILDKD